MLSSNNTGTLKFFLVPNWSDGDDLKSQWRIDSHVTDKDQKPTSDLEWLKTADWNNLKKKKFFRWHQVVFQK